MDGETRPPDTTPRRSWRRRLARWLGMATVILLLATGFLLWAIDTGPGHRFIADRVSALEPSSGLRIRIGRIDGSIWNRATLRDVRLSDPKGVFLEVPELAVDWRPTGWLANRLDIRSLETDLAIFHRVPKLLPSRKKKKAILPDFDIRIDRLSVRRLRVEPAVAGKRHLAIVLGSADIRNGRAKILLAIASTAKDKLRLKLDAAPDRDRFDLDLKLAAPTDGVIGAVIGTTRPIFAEIAGEGRWREWKGAARTDISGHRAVDLALAVNAGEYRLSGTLAPAPITSGKLRRLSSPKIDVVGRASLHDRKLDGGLSLRSEALAIRAAGILDLAESAFRDVEVNADLMKPPALFPNMTGRDVRLHLRLDGPFGTAAFAYRLSSPRVAFDTTGFENVEITGSGHLSKAPVTLPVSARAARVTGVGDVAGGILRNLKVDGVVQVDARAIRGQGLQLRSDQLKGRLGVFVDLATGRYDVSLDSSLARYLIPGLGIVDVLTELKVVPGAGGKGTHVEGRGRVWVRRFDNSFLRSLAGGLPQIDTRLRRDADGILHFTNLRLTAPEIRLSGNGYRRRDGTFWFEGGGTQNRYGPVRLTLDGRIDRPRLDIALASPMQALGLAGVRLQLDPNDRGFMWRAQGGSTLGPFAGNGAIILQPRVPALISVAALDVSGTRASGGVRADPGGFTGKLVTSGGGIDGDIMFNPIGTIQRIETHLDFRRARLAGVPDLQVGRGKLDGVVLLDPAGMSVDGSASARGLRRGKLSLGRFAGTVAMKGGNGRITADIAGARGRIFAIKTEAEIAPDWLSITGGGQVDRKPIKLETPAVLTHGGDGWRLDRTTLSFGSGRAVVEGRFGGSATELDATLERIPLSILDIVVPQAGFGGYASGKLSYSLPRGTRLPVGEAKLTIRGMTRSGLVLASRPIDIALAARLTPDKAVGRAVAFSQGRTVGRAQARIGPLPADGTIGDRLWRSPVFGQLRYDGPADTLWRLTQIESIDLSGPIAVAADMSGLVNNPVIRGSMKADGARLESAITGTVIDGIQARGRFDGSQLVISNFAGATKGGGRVSGNGVFNLAAVEGFGMVLTGKADEAELLNRDDIGATITGPFKIESDGSGGLISGDVKLDRSRFRMGRAAVVEVPRLNVTERNRPVQDYEESPKQPWQLDIKANARNRLMVTGLGLDSEWRADLQIKGAVDNPAIVGRADLVRGGYEFAGRRFELDRGTVRFLGQAPPDPVLDVAASANVQGLNASITVTGTGQKPDISFTSVPALPEDELLSRLLFGTSITNLSAAEALQLAAAVASLRGGGNGLNPINAVRRVAGLDRLRILPADVTTGQGTSIAAGKYLGRRTYVELITDGQGYSATRIEFQVTRWLSLLSSISTLGQQSANVRISKDY